MHQQNRKINFPITWLWEEEPDLLFGLAYLCCLWWLLGMKRSSSVLLERGTGLCTEVSFLRNSFKGRGVPWPHPSLVKITKPLVNGAYWWGLQPLSIPATPSCLLPCVNNIKHNQSSLNCSWFTSCLCIFKIAIWEQCSAQKQHALEPGLQVYEGEELLQQSQTYCNPRCSSCAESDASIPMGWRPEGGTRSCWDQRWHWSVPPSDRVVLRHCFPSTVPSCCWICSPSIFYHGSIFHHGSTLCGGVTLCGGGTFHRWWHLPSLMAPCVGVAQTASPSDAGKSKAINANAYRHEAR